MDKRQTRVDPVLWWRVYDRDKRQCVVRQLFPDSSPCTDKWGSPVHIKRNGTVPYELTFAHIKLEPGGARVTDERHGVMVCWGHHVFGDMAVTSGPVLEKVREYLKTLYPA